MSSHMLTINLAGSDDDELADYVEFVAGQIRDGYTSGLVDRSHNWEMVSA